MRAVLGLMLIAIICAPSAALCQDRGLEASNDDSSAPIRPQERRRADPVAREATTLDRGATINLRLLDNVRDSTLGVRYEERDAYFRILQLAQEVPLTRQKEYADVFREERRQSHPRYSKRKPSEFPNFVDLFQSPDDYRGRPVSLHGVLRKLTKFDPGKNSQGIAEAYEGWLYTDDSQGNPTVIVFTGKPQDLPVGGDLTEEIRVTGYFFKMYGYDAQDVARKAPLLLAGEIEWRPGPKGYVAKPLSLEAYLIATFVVFVVGYAAWQSNRHQMARRVKPPVEADFSKLPPVEHPPTTLQGAPETDDA